MKLSTETLVILVALAFYLYDSLMLLAVNEAVIELGRKSSWSGAFGSNRWKIGGKEPYIPNPLLPHLQTYRLTWAMSVGDDIQPEPDSLRPANELFRLIPFVYVSALCMFVLVPIGFFANLGIYFLTAAIGLMYLNNLVALVVLWYMKAAFNLTNSQFFSLAFECIACPPFAINLIRKLSRLVECKEDFLAASKRLLSDAQLSDVRAECLLRIEEQIDFAPEDSATMKQLKALRINICPDDKR